MGNSTGGTVSTGRATKEPAINFESKKVVKEGLLELRLGNEKWQKRYCIISNSDCKYFEKKTNEKDSNENDQLFLHHSYKLATILSIEKSKSNETEQKQDKYVYSLCNG